MSCDELIDVFSSKAVTFFLYEPNSFERLSYYVEKEGASIFADSSEEPWNGIFQTFVNDQTPLKDNNDLYIPLKTDKTRAFGFAVLHNARQETEEGLNNIELAAMDSFSQNLLALATSSISSGSLSPVLSIKNLVVEYKTGQNVTTAIKGLDLDICRGEFSLILGASGCGKTSLLNVMGAMLTPKQGQVLYDGKDITKFSREQASNYRKETVGFVFQQYNLISDLNAKENIEVASSLVEGAYPAKQVLDMVGLSSKAKNYPGQMSGGEQQRVCIARALVKKPKLLLCDEPTGALDTENAIRVMEILQNLVKQHNIPVVMITHNPDFSSLADHYILMSNGKIVEDFRQPFVADAKNLNIQ